MARREILTPPPSNEMRDLAHQLRLSLPVIARLVRMEEARAPQVFDKAALLARYRMNEEELREAIARAGLAIGGKGRALRVHRAELAALDEAVRVWYVERSRNLKPAPGEHNPGTATAGRRLTPIGPRMPRASAPASNLDGEVVQ